MKHLLTLITLVLASGLALATDLGKLHTVWQGKQYTSHVLFSGEAKLISWNDKSKAPPISAEVALQKAVGWIQSAGLGDKTQVSNIHLDDYSNAKGKSLWAWKVTFRNGEKGTVRTAGRELADKEKLYFFVYFDGTTSAPKPNL